MTWFDYAVLAIMSVSVLIGIMRGFVRESLALAAWVVAFFVAQKFSTDVERLIASAITVPWLRSLAAFVGLFLAVLLVMSLLAFLVSRLVQTTGLGLTDRALGAVFGLVRGLAVVLMAMLIAGFTPLPRQAAWRDAMFSAPLMALAQVVRLWMPPALAKHINYP